MSRLPCDQMTPFVHLLVVSLGIPAGWISDGMTTLMLRSSISTLTQFASNARSPSNASGAQALEQLRRSQHVVCLPGHQFHIYHPIYPGFPVNF